MFKHERPRQFDGPVREAYEFALDQSEPVFVPVSYFADDRGWSVMNQFQQVLAPEGQVNFSMTYPNVIKAWHRHHHQTDFWICLVGHIKAGVYRDDDQRAWLTTIGEKRQGTLIIPPQLWHGVATVGTEPAGLLYYVTKAYNPAAPDEERKPYDSIEGFPWRVQHG